MLANTLALCQKNTDKCNRVILGSESNLKFLKKIGTRKLTLQEQQKLDLIYKNLTQTGLEAVSEIYVTKACPLSGECTLFGREDSVFSKWAKDIQKSNITGIRRIGKPSVNGFITELKLTNPINNGVQVLNYDTYVVLKSNLDKESDNLYYEWLVGLYLNSFMDRFPIFCKTYDLYEYRKPEDKLLIQENPEENGLSVIKQLITMDHVTGMTESLKNPERLCLVVQHVHKSVAFIDLLEEWNLLNDETEQEKMLLKREIICILYQLFFVLPLIPGFSHNDLHAGNVILTPSAENKHYRFYYNDRYFDCKYAAKLIDYGRCLFNGTSDFKQRLDVTVKEMFTIQDDELIEEIQKNNGYPWQYIGTTQCISLDFRLLNICIDYGILDESFYSLLEMTVLPANFKSNPCHIFTRANFTENNHHVRHNNYVSKKMYPNIRSVAPNLNIEPYIYPNSQCFCTIYVSNVEKMRVVWPNLNGGKVRKSRKHKRT
jgi:hypothetical protein